jgi:CubicO group peptidase (beta-lactamase class C family)
MTSDRSAAVVGVASSPTHAVAAEAPPAFADASATDPVAIGWMQGAPPAADKLIRYEDGSFYRFPQWRWSFSHWRELVATINVPRGPGPVSALARRERADLDSVAFTVLGGTRRMTWAESLQANYTDGIVVLHRGHIVCERYFGALSAERPHIAFSVTKSFFGVIAAMLIADGTLDPGAPVARYLPELTDSGFGDATVAAVLDMTTALRYTEQYGDPDSDVARWSLAIGFLPRPPGYAGPRSDYAYLATIAGDGEHGRAFTYRSVNTDVIGWLIARLTGKPAQQVLQERLWSRLGVEDDAHLQVDPDGTPLVALALNARLRDMARFGEMMRLDGAFNGQQIVPAAVVADIRGGASRAAFATAGYPTLPGWSYHNQWWVSHNDHGAFMARGIHGQAIYVDPRAEMVIARFASHPLAGNVNLDPTSLPAYAAIADRLMAG